jgi:hypothetical protein
LSSTICENDTNKHGECLLFLFSIPNNNYFSYGWLAANKCLLIIYLYPLIFSAANLLDTSRESLCRLNSRDLTHFLLEKLQGLPFSATEVSLPAPLLTVKCQRLFTIYKMVNGGGMARKYTRCLVLKRKACGGLPTSSSFLWIILWKMWKGYKMKFFGGKWHFLRFPLSTPYSFSTPHF